MTLALAGKTRRRRTVLVLAAFISIIISSLGGLGVSQPASATVGPDLQVTKSNDVNGSIQFPGSFAWTLEVRNKGNRTATFGFSDYLLRDNLPTNNGLDGAGAYTALVVTNHHMDPDEFDDFECILTPGAAAKIECRAFSNRWVDIDQNDGFDVSITVTPGSIGTYANPKTDGECKVDPDSQVSETNEGNNTCSDAVTVAEGNIQVHKYLPKQAGDPDDGDGGPANAPWQNQGNGQGTWTFAVYTTLADANADTNRLAEFSQLGSNSPDIPQTNLWLREVGLPASNEYFGFYVPDGDNNSGNDKCNQRLLDGSNMTTTGNVLELPAANWTTKGNQTGLFHVCAYNKPAEPATGTVIVMKVITSDSGDTTTAFSGTLKNGSVNVAGSPFSDLVQGTAKTFSGLAMGTYDLVETPLTSGFNLLGYKAGSGTTAPTCPAPEALESSISATLTNDGDVKVLCIYNEAVEQPTGTLVIHKQKTATSPADATTVFSGTVDSNSALPWSLTGIGGQSAAITLPTGDHTVQEVAANGWTRADGGLLALATGSAAPTCSTNPADYTLTAAAVTAGVTTHVCVLNQKQEQVLLRTLFVNKVIISPAPDNTAVFGGIVDSLVSLPWQTTNGVAVLVKNDLQPGVYHVHEDAKAGYNTLGFAVVYAGAGAVCPAGPTATTEGLADLSGPNTVATVCVYNQPRVNITVNKVEVTDGVSNAGQGWKITLTGCGIDNTKTTSGTFATAEWTDLAPCANYTVSEDTNSKPGQGFTPVGPSTVTFAATGAGQTYNVTFTNGRITFVPFTFETPVPETPTPVLPTPVPPTATPVTPTIVTDVVLGEKTPDVLATPIAPVTGTGAPAGGNSANVLFILIGIAILGTGFALANASRRRDHN